jgi:acyl carrier protein
MTKEETFERVKSYLVDGFGIAAAAVVPTAHLIDDLDLDSIDAIDLAVVLQEQTNIDVAEHELQALRIVQDVVDLVLRKQGAA